MQDQLDKFMRENRAAFDAAEPDSMIWDNIEKAITPAGQSKVVNIWGYARVAAVAILLLTIGAIGGSYFSGSAYQSPGLVMQDLSTEYAEAEAYYVSQINQKMDQIKTFDLSESVVEDIQSLNDEFNSLRSKLGDEVTDEVIISAMIENYKTKIRILERVVDRMEKSEQEKTKHNDEIQL
ncbi:MAG: hypothetical protein AAF502_04730 [Bacteroidota bacterium]